MERVTKLACAVLLAVAVLAPQGSAPAEDPLLPELEELLRKPASKPPVPLPKPSGKSARPAPKAQYRPRPAAPPAPRRRDANGPVAGVTQIVFAVRSSPRDGHWYANFGYWVYDPNRMMYGNSGGRLCRLDLPTGRASDIFHDPNGSVRDPCVSYDARKILFSYRKGGSRYFNLYEIPADANGEGPGSSRLRQITDGPWDDIEPIYLPDGDLMFCSSRCKRYVQCWFTHVAIIYRCRPDGSDIRCVSANVEHDNTPWVLPDGRILYMRWEYVDRSQVQFHHLWTFNPDGSNVMVYFGNMHPGTALLDAKPIPRTNKVVTIVSPGHGRQEHAGRVAVINPNGGPDDLESLHYVSRSGSCRDPYPLSEDMFVVADGNRLVLLYGDGQTDLLHQLTQPGMLLHEPRPLAPRGREHAIPPRSDWKQPTGRLVLADVHVGRKMDGVRPGDIKKLLILESLPKPVNFSGGMEPLSVGGTFTLERVVGTVPVEPDGSAYMELPALRPLFFVALDANGNSVKRMQSFTNVTPGETTSCVGCHEQRYETARTPDNLMALRRPPSRIEPVAGVNDVIDFPRDVQPILDRYCAGCHGYGKSPAKDLLLGGGRGPMYSHAYWSLMARQLVAHGRNAQGNRPPRTIGTSASPLMRVIDPPAFGLKEGWHNDVKLTARERMTVRMWIESGAAYPGTYAALGFGFIRPAPLDGGVIRRRCGGCHGVPRSKFTRELAFNLTDPARSPVLLAPLAKEAGGWGLCSGTATFRSPLAEAPAPRALPSPAPAPGASPILASGMGADGPDDPFARAVDADPIWREMQAKLAAERPAAKAAVRPTPSPAPAGKPHTPLRVTRQDVAVVFESAGDPDYQALLACIRAAKEQLDSVTRFDMPDFRPNEHYVREMKRYGILPKQVDPAASRLDAYALDRAYWRSFWHTPRQ